MFSFIEKIIKPSFKTISTDELKEVVASRKGRLLDVRSAQEYHGGHINGAQHFPLEKVSSYKGSQKEPIYLICQSGMRSRRAAAVLSKMGYQVINVKGGMSAWSGKVVGGK